MTTPADPLGLSADQRIQSDLTLFWRDLQARRDGSIKAITNLPAGSIVSFMGINYTREHLLELIA